MRLPPARIKIDDGLALEPRDVDDRVVHEHVMKHPFGLGQIYGIGKNDVQFQAAGRRRWNAEGWDSVGPPVIGLEERQQTSTAVRALHVDAERCGAARLDNEAHGGMNASVCVPCKLCPPMLAAACRQELLPVTERYVAELNKLVGAAECAVRISRTELFGLLDRGLRQKVWPSVVVSTGTLGTGGVGIRLSSAQGLRCEFYYDALGARWRTLFRVAPRGANDVVSFLAHILIEDPRAPLSGSCFVERRWYEEVQ